MVEDHPAHLLLAPREALNEFPWPRRFVDEKAVRQAWQKGLHQHATRSNSRLGRHMSEAERSRYFKFYSRAAIILEVKFEPMFRHESQAEMRKQKTDQRPAAQPCSLAALQPFT